MKPWDEMEALFWPAFERAGMLVDAQVLLAGTDVPKMVKIEFCEPTVNPMTGVQSTDYDMQYQYADLPTLAEADQVVVDGILYRVREASRTDGQYATGFHRWALLTKVGLAC